MLENIHELQYACKMILRKKFRQASTRWNKIISDGHRRRLK